MGYNKNKKVIKPYKGNNQYWQYQGKPILLLGGSKEDNLFQIPDLQEQLDLLADSGGNYIRNVMSSRDEDDVWPHKLIENKYDLNQWNEEYWNRFEKFLSLTLERDIIVQIEVWDRFDFSRDPWQKNSWNPLNNINYAPKESGLETEYPLHPGKDVQTFFHTVPGMEEYNSHYDLVRSYQKKYVDKLLSYSLTYPQVLYCINNETNTSPLWGKYWIKYIKEKAKNQGREVYVTDMLDNFWKPDKSPEFQMVIEQTCFYDFIDISQINSRNFARKHWDKLMYVFDHMKENIRPLNNTKVYGSGNTSWGSGTPQDGVERFIRDILAGCASARFHRPTSGNGLSPLAQSVIKSIRKVEEHIKLWEVEPRMDLINQLHNNGAYLVANPGEKYLIYFTNGRTVRLNLKDAKGDFRLIWINIESGEMIEGERLIAGNVVNIAAPAYGGWLAIII